MGALMLLQQGQLSLGEDALARCAFKRLSKQGITSELCFKNSPHTLPGDLSSLLQIWLRSCTPGGLVLWSKKLSSSSGTCWEP